MKWLNDLFGIILSKVHTFWEGMFLLGLVMVFVAAIVVILLKFISKWKISKVKVGPVEVETNKQATSNEIEKVIEAEVKEEVKEIVDELKKSVKTSTGIIV